MAPFTEPSHVFQKLKLNTRTPHKPVSSSFASIPRCEFQREGDSSSALTTPELAESHSLNHSHNGRYGKHGNGEEPAEGQQQAQSYDSAAASSFNDIENTFRKRRTSISFDQKVTLDCGNRHSIEEPLPKLGVPPTLPEIDGEDYSDNGSYFVQALDRRKEATHRVGVSRYPLLRTTVDGLAADPTYGDHENVASLTSEATASPPLEEVRTPLEASADYLLSPLPASSPIEFPSSLSRRNGSQRSKGFRELSSDGSVRKMSRRSSARSGRSLSSMSPASAFLSHFNSRDEATKPVEPDDEGQEIGDHSQYIIGKQIGYGGFSVVKEAYTFENNVKVTYAVKIVRKELAGKQEIENEALQTQFEHEVEVWRYLKHPYILPLLRVYNTDFATFCITKLNAGGTLFDVVRNARQAKPKGVAPRLAKRYVYQLASAIRYLHNDITLVHRDIKLENCLVDMSRPNAKTEGGNVLLCDFGMADYIVSDHRDTPEPHSGGPNQNIGPSDTSTCIAGSLQYAAPELFNTTGSIFSTAADIWAFGVVVYAIITGELPFNAGLDSKTTRRILEGDWDIGLLRKGQAARESPDDVVDLVRGCLAMDPARRWTITEILKCRWLEGCQELYEHVERPWIS